MKNTIRLTPVIINMPMKSINSLNFGQTVIAYVKGAVNHLIKINCFNLDLSNKILLYNINFYNNNEFVEPEFDISNSLMNDIEIEFYFNSNIYPLVCTSTEIDIKILCEITPNL